MTEPSKLTRRVADSLAARVFVPVGVWLTCGGLVYAQWIRAETSTLVLVLCALTLLGCLPGTQHPGRPPQRRGLRRVALRSAMGALVLGGLGAATWQLTGDPLHRGLLWVFAPTFYGAGLGVLWRLEGFAERSPRALFVPATFLLAGFGAAAGLFLAAVQAAYIQELWSAGSMHQALEAGRAHAHELLRRFRGDLPVSACLVLPPVLVLVTRVSRRGVWFQSWAPLAVTTLACLPLASFVVNYLEAFTTLACAIALGVLTAFLLQVASAVERRGGVAVKPAAHRPHTKAAAAGAAAGAA